MTPTALKPAPRSAGHPNRTAKTRSPQAPRRVSGPAGGIARPKPTRSPARRSGSRRSLPAGAAGTSAWAQVLGQRLAVRLRALPDHALLDRMIRGRAWIPLLGVMLAGIVAMQVEVLKLNAGMGRSLERATALQSRNEILRATVAGLADDQRIERTAARMGMVMPAPDAVGFLTVRRGGDGAGAVSGIHAPDSSAFSAALPSPPSTAASPVSANGVVPATAAGAVAPTTSSAGASAAGSAVAANPASASSASPVSAAPPVPASGAGSSSATVVGAGSGGSTGSGTDAGVQPSGTSGGTPVGG